MGEATYRILDYFSEEEFKAGRSFLLESNFKPEFDNSKFQNWQKKYNVNVVQILCYADGDVLFERFKERALSGQRHPGHDDANNLEEFRNSLPAGKGEALDLVGHVLEIDTTNFNTVDYSAVLNEVKELIKT